METVRTVKKVRDKLIYTLFSEKRDGEYRYGISVTSLIFGMPETAEAKDVTADPDAAENILDMLAENEVLPSLLRELVDECTSAIAL